jgi:hypothetical protein
MSSSVSGLLAPPHTITASSPQFQKFGRAEYPYYYPTQDPASTPNSAGVEPSPAMCGFSGYFSSGAPTPASMVQFAHPGPTSPVDAATIVTSLASFDNRGSLAMPPPLGAMLSPPPPMPLPDVPSKPIAIDIMYVDEACDMDRSPSPTTNMPLQIQVPIFRTDLVPDDGEGYFDGQSSEDDTYASKQSFDFTGELQKLRRTAGERVQDTR